MKKHGLWCWFQDLGSFWSVNQVCECPCRLYSLWTLWSMGPLVILPMVSQVGVFFWEAVLTSLQRYTEVNITVFNLQLGGSSMDMTHYLDWNKFLIQDSCSPAFMQIMLLIIVEIVCRLHRAVIIERWHPKVPLNVNDTGWIVCRSCNLLRENGSTVGPFCLWSSGRVSM